MREIEMGRRALRCVRSKRRVRTDDGAAAVEFALLVVPLLLIIFGIISYGFMLTTRQGLSQAAAEGARAAAVQVDSTKRTTSAQTAINNALSGNPGGAVTCTGGNLMQGGNDVGGCVIGSPASCAGQTDAQCVTVTLTFDYRDHPAVPSPPLVGQLLPEHIPYSATVRVS